MKDFKKSFLKDIDGKPKTENKVSEPIIHAIEKFIDNAFQDKKTEDGDPQSPTNVIE